MIKVAATHEARSHVLELANVFRARVVDVAPDSLTIEITGAEDKIDGLLEVLRPYGVLEMVRTGIVAMRRGSRSAAGSHSGCHGARRSGRQCFLLGVRRGSGAEPAASVIAIFRQLSNGELLLAGPNVLHPL